VVLTGYRGEAAAATLAGMQTAMTFEQRRAEREVIRLIERIRSLTAELEDLRRRDRGNPELRAKERALDELHWRLAGAARRAAGDDLLPAA
jgi:hypothetical protein